MAFSRYFYFNPWVLIIVRLLFASSAPPTVLNFPSNYIFQKAVIRFSSTGTRDVSRSRGCEDSWERVGDDLDGVVVGILRRIGRRVWEDLAGSGLGGGDRV